MILPFSPANRSVPSQCLPASEAALFSPAHLRIRSGFRCFPQRGGTGSGSRSDYARWLRQRLAPKRSFSPAVAPAPAQGLHKSWSGRMGSPAITPRPPAEISIPPGAASAEIPAFDPKSKDPATFLFRQAPVSRFPPARSAGRRQNALHLQTKDRSALPRQPPERARPAVNHSVRYRSLIQPLCLPLPPDVAQLFALIKPMHRALEWIARL